MRRSALHHKRTAFPLNGHSLVRDLFYQNAEVEKLLRGFCAYTRMHILAACALITIVWLSILGRDP
jgi:hypothetical protein